MRSPDEIRRMIGHLKAARISAFQLSDLECADTLTDLINALEWALGENSEGAEEFAHLALALDVVDLEAAQSAAAARRKTWSTVN